MGEKETMVRLQAEAEVLLLRVLDQTRINKELHVNSDPGAERPLTTERARIATLKKNGET